MTGALRVLHVVPRLDRIGGLERQALALAGAQARAGHDVHVLTHAPVSAPRRERRDGCEIHRLRHGLRHYHPAAWWRSAVPVFDVVHAHGLDLLAARVVARARRDGVPTLVKLASPGDLDLFLRPGDAAAAAAHDELAPAAGPLRRALRRTAWSKLAQADLFLALDDATAARLLAEGLPHERSRNGVDTTRFAPPDALRRGAARAALGCAPDEFVVASLGRLAARKDQATIVAAVARLAGSAAQHGDAARSGPDVRLLLAGEGPQRGALQSAVRAAGLDGRARLLGAVADPRELLAAADVFVHASRSEGQPNAALEALACGLPVVLSDIPAHRALRVNDAARWFVPGDDAALARQLDALRAAPALRIALGAVARRRAVESFELADVASDLVALYARLSRREPTP